MRETRLDFIESFGVTAYLELNATVLGKYEYVEEGTTHIVLHLDNTTYPWIEATPRDITAMQWNELMATEQTQNVTARIEKRGERWMMTYFESQNPPIAKTLARSSCQQLSVSVGHACVGSSFLSALIRLLLSF